MFTLIGQNFINMIKSFYPQVKVASGGKEVVVRCQQCGDSKDPKHAHLYIKVPQTANELALYQCKKCNFRGVVDDAFLRRYGCQDPRVLIDVVKHNNELFKSPSYAMMKKMDIYPLKNTFVSNHPRIVEKIQYINNRIGANFNVQDLIKLKIFLNLYDILNQNRLQGTRHKMVTDALNDHFIGFISYDNSYSIMRKVTEDELYKTVNKRYINYNIIDKLESGKDFYVIPTRINVEDPLPVRIHIAEGVFDIISIYYNLYKCDDYQNIYIAAAGKSYAQALNFILNETGIINYELHIYPDNDISQYELEHLILKRIRMLCCSIHVHNNMYPGEKDFGVPIDRIKPQEMIIHEQQI